MTAIQVDFLTLQITETSEKVSKCVPTGVPKSIENHKKINPGTFVGSPECTLAHMITKIVSKWSPRTPKSSKMTSQDLQEEQTLLDLNANLPGNTDHVFLISTCFQSSKSFKSCKSFQSANHQSPHWQRGRRQGRSLKIKTNQMATSTIPMRSKLKMSTKTTQIQLYHYILLKKLRI